MLTVNLARLMNTVKVKKKKVKLALKQAVKAHGVVRC
jgi:hypothetical protein